MILLAAELRIDINNLMHSVLLRRLEQDESKTIS